MKGQPTQIPDPNVLKSAIGLRASKGGAVAVGLSVDEGEPRVLLSTFLKTSADGDRLSLEPYGVAFEMAAGSQGASAQAVAAVAEGRRRQDELAAKSRNGLRTPLDTSESRTSSAIGLFCSLLGFGTVPLANVTLAKLEAVFCSSIFSRVC